MKHQGISQNLDNLEDLLNGTPGSYEKIREFRSKLKENVRNLFDNVFLLGFREGLLLNLAANYRLEVQCEGCRFFVDYKDAGRMCRLGYKSGTRECKVIKGPKLGDEV